MKKNDYLDPGVDLLVISQLTRNYTGAELETLVKNASTFAITRQISISGQNVNVEIKKELLKVTQEEFLRALDEFTPLFGKASDNLKLFQKKEFIYWNPIIREKEAEIKHKIDSLKRGELSTILIHGEAYCGKTTFAIQCIQDYIKRDDCIRLITAEQLTKNGSKSNYITKTIELCQKADFSILILRGFERIVEWSRISVHYNNDVLQTIIAALNIKVNPDKKMIVIMTCNDIDLLERFELVSYFDTIFDYPCLADSDESMSLLGTHLESSISKIWKILKYKDV